MANKFGWNYKRNYIYYVIAMIIALLTGLLSFLGADNEPQEVRLWWDRNLESDMSHYEVYFWQGVDTTDFSLSTMIFYENVPHVLQDSIGSSAYVFSLDYIRGGATAVDSNGYTSTRALSRFYTYEELFGPGQPANLRFTN